MVVAYLDIDSVVSRSVAHAIEPVRDSVIGHGTSWRRSTPTTLSVEVGL